MALKDPVLSCMHLLQASVARMQDLENKNWIILECIGNNSNTFRELVQNNATYFLSEFISNNTETFREVLQHKTLFVRVHIKQYWHIWRVTTIVGEHGDAPPIPWFFFETSPTNKIDAPNGTLSRLKNGTPPTLKSKAPFQEMILRRKQKKLETVIDTCVSLIKQHWKKMAEIAQICDFQNFKISQEKWSFFWLS